MDTVGPISRTVEDCAITFQAIAGYDSKDQYTWNVPVPDYRAALDGDVSKLRIGVVQEKVYTDELQPEVSQAIIKAISDLGELGASIQDVSIPLISDAGAISKSLTDMGGAAVHHEGLKKRANDYDHNTRVRLLTAILTPAQHYYKAQKLRTMLRQQILDALEKVDVLVLPTSPSPAPKIADGPGVKSQEEANGRIAGVRSFTGAFNVASVPALSLPCGFTSDNLPIALQIAGKPFDEATVMKVAHAYEQATAWHTRRPPI
jgi:aspartyl-tRNA(Asn)/glutamyl-tRNA(Gln) amidotransferase subunit A